MSAIKLPDFTSRWFRSFGCSSYVSYQQLQLVLEFLCHGVF